MSDIVERLRHPKATQAEMEAAAEIERLRDAYEQERRDCINLTEKVVPNLRDEIKRLREERERLRTLVTRYEEDKLHLHNTIDQLQQNIRWRDKQLDELKERSGGCY